VIKFFQLHWILHITTTHIYETCCDIQIYSLRLFSVTIYSSLRGLQNTTIITKVITSIRNDTGYIHRSTPQPILVQLAVRGARSYIIEIITHHHVCLW
jgi:hypothetical protein